MFNRWRKIMTDIADTVVAISAKLDTLSTAVASLATAVAAIQPSASVDLTPVLTELADIKAQLVPTPAPPPAPEPAPDSAPATAA